VANGGEDAVMLLADRSGEPHERRESAARSSRAEALKQFVDIIDAETRREDASERYL
jgi:coenzyme F420-reducing hydrogenase delta subunit